MAGARGDFKQRLGRMRRETPVPPETPGPAETPGRSVELDPSEATTEPAPARRGLPVWLQARLARSGSGGGVVDEVHGAHPRTEGPPRDLVEGEGPLGPFAFRRTVFDPAAPHGDWRLREVDEVDREALGLVAADPEVAGIDPRRAVYFDIETTGLSGGAGTTPFMVCLGSFRGEAFELWQGFLRDPSEEPAMLAEVARRVAASSGMVSFFGKSFDRHRLEDKMRMHGIRAPFAERPHFDLYHGCRRLYRDAFEDGRLQTMERGLCGVVREHDLSGAYAPAAWFDFLADRPHLCEQVFTHNLLDVLSLVTLHAHLGRALAERRGDGRALDGDPSAGEVRPTARSRAVGLGRLFEKRRDHASALVWFERAQARGGLAPELAFLRARSLARVGDGAAAFEAFAALGTVRTPLAARALFEAARHCPDGQAERYLGRSLELAELFDPRLAERARKRLSRLRQNS